MKPRLTAYLYLLIVSVIWGAASPVVKFTLQWFDPWIFLTYRMAVSSIIAFIYFALAKTKIPKNTGDLSLVLICDFLSTPVAIGLFFLALTKTSALTGSMLTAGAPLLLVLAGILFFKDRVTKTEKLGIAVTLLGTALIAFGPFIFGGTSTDGGVLTGNLIMIGATIADIAGAVLAKMALRRKVEPAFLAQSQFILGLVFFLPLALAQHSFSQIIEIISTAPLAAHTSALFMAVLSGTFAYTIRNIAAKSIEVSEAALFSYLQPIWAAILAVFWLKEGVTLSYSVGGIIIAIGVLIAEIKKKSLSK